MAGNVVNLLLLVLAIALILLLFTACDRIFALPLLNPSRHATRDLLIASEDLLLPLGSFPSKLLHPWGSTVENCQSNPTALPLSPKPTPAQGGSKPNPTPASSEPTPDESGSTPTAMPLPQNPPPVDAGFNTTTVPSPAEPIPDDGLPLGSEDYLDEPFFDSLEYQQTSDDETLINKPSVDVPLPEQQDAEIDSLGSASTVVGEEKEQDQEEDNAAVVEEVSTERQAFEKTICELVDPEGRYGLDLQKMIELIVGTIKQRVQTEEGLRSETVRFQRAEEDLRHGWEDAREVFERIISGQNTMLSLTQQKNDELVEENETLLSDKDGSEAKYQRMKERFNRCLKSINTAKIVAEQAAETARSGVEGRIDELKERYERNKSAAELKDMQEKNTLIFSKRMVENSLANARRQATVDQQQHKTEVKDKDRTIHELSTTVRQIRSEVTMSEQLAASVERGHQKQLDDQRKEKDEEIRTLRDRLRESTDEIKMLGGWKAKAEAAERNSERLSNRLEDELTTPRGDKEHIIAGLKLDVRGLRRTIGTNEATINRLEGRITGLESGEEVQRLKSQLENSQKQIQEQQRENKNLQGIIKARDEKIKEDAKVSSKEKGNLKKQLEQATRVPDKGPEEEARKLEEQKKDLSRKLEKDKKEAVENAVRKAAEDVKSKEREHEKYMQETAEKAAKEAKELDDERKAFREAQEKATKTERDLRAELVVLKSQLEKVTESTSVDPADPQPGKDMKELTLLDKEVGEAKDLLLEIGRNGINQGSIEHTVLQELNNAKLALSKIKGELRKPHGVADKNRLNRMMYGAKVNEQHFEQLDITTQEFLVQQAKVVNARLVNLKNILDKSDDVQTEAMLEAINASNPFNRKVQKVQGLKRHTQPGANVLPPTPSTGVQAGYTMGKSQQTNGHPEQQYGPRLFNLPQNEKPQFPMATPQDQAQGFAPTHFGGAPNGSASQIQTIAMPDSTSSQGAPRSADVGSSSLTPRNLGDQRKGTLSFDFNAIDTSHPIWKGVNFNRQNEASKEANATQSTTMPQGSANVETSSAQYTPSTGFRFDASPMPMTSAQNRGSTDRTTEAKKDRPQSSLAEIIASFTASSDTKTTAVVPESVSKNNNTSSTGPAELPAKTPHPFSFGEQSPLPGLQDGNGTTDLFSVSPSQLPKNNGRGRGRLNASKGRQLAHKAFATRQTVPLPELTQGQQSGPQEQIIGIQQEDSGGPSQQEHRSDQPKGWTANMTSFVQDLLGRGHTSVDRITTLLKRTYDSVSAAEGVERYVERLKNEHENRVPEMPAGWTDSVTEIVKHMLRHGDDISLIEEFVKEDPDIQKNDTDCLEQWLKKLQSDYEAELEDSMQQG